MSVVWCRHLSIPLAVLGLLALGCDEAIDDPAGTGSQGELVGLTVLEGDVPLSGVGLQLLSEEQRLSATSDDEGGFGFAALDAGVWTLVASPPVGFALRSGEFNPREIEIVAAQRTDVSIALVNETGSGSIVAQVLADSVTSDGSQHLPVAGVLVKATGPGALEIIRSARSGDNGLAVIPAPPGEYTVEVELPEGWKMAEGSEQRLTDVKVTAGASTRVEFRIAQDGSVTPPTKGTIAGTALLNDIEPVTGLRVELARDDFIQVQETGPEGRFEFGDLSQGEWSLQVFPPEGLVLAPDEPDPQKVVIGPGNLFQPINISLMYPEGTGALVAHAVADSAHLSGVEMRVYEADAGAALESGLTGSNGRAVFTLPPGSYDVEVVVPDGYALPEGEQARRGVFIVSAGHASFAWFELLTNGP